MDKEIAKSLISLAVSMDATIGKMFSEVRNFSDEELKIKYRKAVEEIMGSIAKEIILPLVNRYPDLNPD